MEIFDVDNGIKEVSKIVRIEISPARKVFGPTTQHPDRPVVVAWTENGARFVATIPHGAKYHNGKLKILDPVKYQKSVGYKGSKFGAFVYKYKCCPCVGLEVVTHINGRGYFTIDLGDENVESRTG